MFLTIVELAWRLEDQILRLIMTDQSILLPEPAMKVAISVYKVGKRKGTYVFREPTKRTSGLPFLENATLEEPPRCPLVVSITGHVVVGG
jgi:hypothetical protein